MQMQVLPPGVQHGEETNLGAQVLGVAGNGEQGCRDGAEQDLIDDHFVVESDRGNLFRHGEDHVEDNWVLLSDYYFFVMFSMVVMGFVMVFEWDALFPDRKDYLILTPLPLSGGSIFAGKTLALVIFLGLFAVDANFFCTMLAPLVTGGEGTPAPVIGRLIAVHAASVLGAGTFVALSIASVQGVLINLLTGR